MIHNAQFEMNIAKTNEIFNFNYFISNNDEYNPEHGQ